MQFNREVEEHGRDIIKASGLALIDDLSAALRMQSATYTILANTTEPRSERQRADAKKVAAKLREALDTSAGLRRKADERCSAGKAEVVVAKDHGNPSLTFVLERLEIDGL